MNGTPGNVGTASTEFSTTPPRREPPPRQQRQAAELGWAVAVTLLALAALGAIGLVLALAMPSSFLGRAVTDETDGALSGAGLSTLLVFGAAVAAWTRSRLDDTFVALAAAALLVVLGTLDPDDLFGSLGSEPIWLLVAAFILAAGINRTGLPARIATSVAAHAHTPRQLVHLLTAAVVLTALLVPTTSGRAALLLPVHAALAAALTDRPRLVRALSALLPTVVLLSAVASLLGAGAHLITTQILAGTTGQEIGFARWLVLGLPFAVVSSHLAAELVLLLFTRGADRRTALRVDGARLREQAGVASRLRRGERLAALLLALVVVLWSTTPLHGLPPALVALGGALLIASPRLGTIRLGSAVGTVPWSLLLFMAATAALGIALADSGAAGWLAGQFLDGEAAGGLPLLVPVVLLSLAAHLLVQSRSARSTVLIPMVVPAALAAGMNPAALAFASTAAAGFCHTLPSSAKPVAMFARVEGVPTYDRGDLLKLSALLGPLLAALILLFATCVWPYLGLPLR